MDNNTHGDYIATEGFTAFIDGIPDECEHKWDGDVIMHSSSGKTIYWHTYRQWAHYCSDLRNKLIHDYHLSIDDPIVEAGVTCSKCKKPYSPPLY